MTILERPERPESEAERRNRHWAELLQELRVLQTGVQLLTAFLLAVPFQARFTTLSDTQTWIYLVVVLLAVAATGLLVMPVSLHRAVFRRQERETLINVANRLAQIGLMLFALAVTGVVLLVFDVAKGAPTSIIASAATLFGLVMAWAVVPAVIRSHRQVVRRRRPPRTE